MKQDNRDKLDLGAEAVGDTAGVLPKARTDVEITEQVYYGKPCYVLKDPTSLRYYRLRPPEQTIYSLLTGKNTMDDILSALGERFPMENFDAQAVMNFIVMLRGANLLQAGGEGSSEYLLRRKRQMTQNWFAKLRREYLFLRFPLLDPDRFLTYLERHLGGILFGRLMMGLVWVMLIGAVVLLLSNIDKLNERQPLLSWINLLYLGPSLFLIKVIHEFGHGLASKHYDLEVHEMGILFLVFMPCMYCDVSDAWMIGQKRKRMWITAAGIVVEIVLAGLATYVWAFTESKTIINQFALNVMLVASVNTILFNGNPLLRYDGYFFLMDLMEIPNLKQKGTSYLWYLVQYYVLGDQAALEPIDVRGREVGVVSYALCSGVYRWFIMLAITTMVWRFLDPYGWGVIGAIMAVGCLYNALIAPVIKFVKYVFTQRHRLHVRLATAAVLVGLLGGATYGVLAVPVEQSVEVQCILRPKGGQAQTIYVRQSGFVGSQPKGDFIRDGQLVAAGEVLLQLTDEQLEYEVKDLELSLMQLATQKGESRTRGELGKEAQIEAEIQAKQAQYDRARYNLSKLTITAPHSGVLQLLVEEPLEKLQGRQLPLQLPLFAIYPAGQFEAVAAVNHRDIGLIETGQAAQIKLWALDSEVFSSEVTVKPPMPVLRMSSAAFSTVFGGEVPTMPVAEAKEALEPADNTYELVLPLREQDERLREGMVGRAKIIEQKQTLGWAVYFWFIQTLRQDIRL